MFECRNVTYLILKLSIFYPGRLQVQTLQFRPVSSPLAKLTAYWQYLVLSIFLLTASHGLHHMTYEYLIM